MYLNTGVMNDLWATAVIKPHVCSRCTYLAWISLSLQIISSFIKITHTRKRSGNKRWALPWIISALTTYNLSSSAAEVESQNVPRLQGRDMPSVSGLTSRERC